MLKTLHIENIAVIERADVEFSAGLSVLTGETGAGKSIIIDSLNAVLGNRVSRELVRSGAERASVTASFESAQAERWCADNEIDADDGEIILQRRISTDGKSTGRVKGVPVTASPLRELGAALRASGIEASLAAAVLTQLALRQAARAKFGPSCGFSLAVSGITRPEAVVVSASSGSTRTRSSSGLIVVATSNPFLH